MFGLDDPAASVSFQLLQFHCSISFGIEVDDLYLWAVIKW